MLGEVQWCDKGLGWVTAAQINAGTVAPTNWHTHLVPSPLCSPPLLSSYTSFQGCGGNGWWDLQVVEMKSMIGSSQTVCLDSIRLLPGSSSSRRRAS